MPRVLRAGQADDGAFDLEFWRRVGAEGIFAAAWQMATNPDFEDLLSAEAADFVFVGAHAVMFYTTGGDDGSG